MKKMSGKIVAWLNDALRDYVYGPRSWFNPLRIVFVVMVAFVASLVGNAFAQYMSPAPAGVGTFEDGYMYRHLFEIGAVAFVLAAVLARRAFHSLCASYVRRLDMDDAILAGSVKPNASEAGVKNKPSFSTGNAGSENGDYAGDAGDREGNVSEGSDA